jgi:hypothetical protein
MNPKKSSLRHMMVKQLQARDKEQMLKATRE